MTPTEQINYLTTLINHGEQDRAALTLEAWVKDDQIHPSTLAKLLELIGERNYEKDELPHISH